jgi:hypothetical protein
MTEQKITGFVFGGVQFASLLGCWLSLLRSFRGFPESLQANAEVVHTDRTRQFSSNFPTHTIHRGARGSVIG